MDDEISCDDPQFMNMLETCLGVEIETLKNTLSDLGKEIKSLKVKTQEQLQVRKELKERTRNTQENSLVLSTTLSKHTKYINEISDKIELMKLNLDPDYKVMKMECDRFENISKEYEEAWQAYYAKYEEFPLAKTRKEARIKLEKLRIEKMVIEYKINELERMWQLNQHVTWLRMRGKIVELAREISNGLQLDRTLQDTNKHIEECNNELNAANTELNARMKKEEEEKRKRALKLLQMPPPTINLSHIRSIYGSRLKTSSVDEWKKNYENSIDTMSVDTLMLEEMCMAEENSIQLPRHTLDQLEEDNNLNAKGAPIDRTSSSSGQDQEDVEHSDVASEMYEHDELAAIDAAADEVMEQERLEEAALPSSVSKDKQTVQRSGGRPDGLEDPVAKRMKLISEVGETPPVSRRKPVRAEKKRSQLFHPTSGPRITNIESVLYNLPSTRKTDQRSFNRATGSRSSQLSCASPEAKITEIEAARHISPARKFAQDNPDPSSMFTPRHYDYSDNSEISFCMDTNMPSLKADQISLYGGSVRDFCECSNSSMPNEDIEMTAARKENRNLGPTTKEHSFTQFDFGKIMKGKFDRNTLF